MSRFVSVISMFLCLVVTTLLVYEIRVMRVEYEKQIEYWKPVIGFTWLKHELRYNDEGWKLVVKKIDSENSIVKDIRAYGLYEVDYVMDQIIIGDVTGESSAFFNLGIKSYDSIGISELRIIEDVE